MNSTKKILYVDMDNVLVDFTTGIDQLTEEQKLAYEGRLDEVPHIFSLMQPMPMAIESYNRLAEKYDVYILSTAPWENPTAWHDKHVWVRQHLGQSAKAAVFIQQHTDNVSAGAHSGRSVKACQRHVASACEARRLRIAGIF